MRKERMRSEWREEEPLTRTWYIFDGETENLKIVMADDQKEAIAKGLSRGVRPRATMEAFPRDGSSNIELMSPGEFYSYMQELTGE